MDESSVTLVEYVAYPLVYEVGVAVEPIALIEWGSETVDPEREPPVTVQSFEFSEVIVNSAFTTGVPAFTNRFRMPLRCSIHLLSKSIPPPCKRTSPFVAPYTAAVNPATVMSSPMSDEYAELLPSTNRGAMTLITWSTASQ